MRRSVWGQRRRFLRPRELLIVLVAVGIVAAGAVWLEPPARPITGHADVVDGDTLRFGSLRVRLTGLDAPELDQTCADTAGGEWSCGTRAKTFLSDLVGRQAIVCTRSGRDRYGRALAKCAAGGRDLGAQIVAAGWAVIDLDYGAEELAARTAGRGIWGGNFVAPAEWRRTHGAIGPGPWEWIRSWFQ
jgi:endonuclease YncB( thermonuclease family)